MITIPHFLPTFAPAPLISQLQRLSLSYGPLDTYAASVLVKALIVKRNKKFIIYKGSKAQGFLFEVNAHFIAQAPIVLLRKNPVFKTTAIDPLKVLPPALF